MGINQILEMVQTTQGHLLKIILQVQEITHKIVDPIKTIHEMVMDILPRILMEDTIQLSIELYRHLSIAVLSRKNQHLRQNLI